MLSSYVKVSDANTGKLKGYQDVYGTYLAKVDENDTLKITKEGLIEGLVVKDNQLIVYASGNLAY